jgi:hypothetical protein
MHALRLPVELPISIYADNKSTKTVAEDSKFRVRTKHIAVPYRYQRQAIENGTIKLIYKSTQDMTTDGLTKPLNGQQFKRFKRLLGIVVGQSRHPCEITCYGLQLIHSGALIYSASLAVSYLVSYAFKEDNYRRRI